MGTDLCTAVRNSLAEKEIDLKKIVSVTTDSAPNMSSSIWIQKFIETRKKLELIEAERSTSNISKKSSNEILEAWNLIPDAFNCLKKLAHAILIIFSSTYACESLFSERNNIKDSLRKRLADDSNSACILLILISYNPDINTCHLIYNSH
ncbi:uncharacterized protein TNCV_1367491 [Trichonephila clavipes]|nr:uncharacterized protein TNCV_1367491 [Trichonephila clavipes]